MHMEALDAETNLMANRRRGRAGQGHAFSRWPADGSALHFAMGLVWDLQRTSCFSLVLPHSFVSSFVPFSAFLACLVGRGRLPALDADGPGHDGNWPSIVPFLFSV
jgi:hypothetical protein